MMEQIKSLLQRLDCTAIESDIYLLLLSQSAQTIKKIADSLGKNRVTIHSAAEKLLESGLLYETRIGKKRIIGAEDPQALLTLLGRKKAEILVMEKDIQNAFPLFAEILNRRKKAPTVKFYAGVDGIKKMFEETLQSHTPVFVYSYAQRLAETVGDEYLNAYFQRRAAKNIPSKLLLQRGPFALQQNKKAKEYKIEMRFMPEEYEWKSGIFSWDDKVAILSYEEKNAHCSIIQSEAISHFFQHIIFDFSWKNAELPD